MEMSRIELVYSSCRFFNKLREKIKKQKEVISLYEDCANEAQTRNYFAERSKLEELLIHEETYWKQRAKSFWLQDGDSNSNYFHVFATTRRKRSTITKLKTASGELVTDHNEMRSTVLEYFKTLFRGNDVLQEDNVHMPEPCITKDLNRKLVEEFTFEEFSHPDKSARPDGLNPDFFQNFWGMLVKRFS